MPSQFIARRLFFNFLLSTNIEAENDGKENVWLKAEPMLLNLRLWIFFSSFYYSLISINTQNLYIYVSRGFKNEKVCVFCEKSGETFKCQGFCCGYFHKDCISKSRSDSAPVASKKEDKNSGKSNFEAEFCNESRTVSEPKNSIHEGKESSKSNSGVETKPDGALEKIQVDKKEENSKVSN